MRLPHLLPLTFLLALPQHLAAQTVVVRPSTPAPTPEVVQPEADAAPVDPLKSVTHVARTTTFLEEKSLIPTNLLRKGSGVKNTYGNTTMVKGGAVPSARSTPVADLRSERSSAMKLYSLRMEPKEHLTVHLKCENTGKVSLRFVRPAKADAMESQFRRMNMIPVASRAIAVDITNITEAPYEVVLMAVGEANYSYRLDFERGQ